MNIQLKAHELKAKLAAGTEITAADVADGLEIAMRSQLDRYRELYAVLKVRAAKAEPEPEKKAAVTQAQVDAAYVEAKKNPSPDNRVRYSKLKTEYEAQGAAQ